MQNFNLKSFQQLSIYCVLVFNIAQYIDNLYKNHENLKFLNFNDAVLA